MYQPVTVGSAQPVTVDPGPFPPGALVLRRMTGSEALGQPFSYEVELVGEDESLDFSQLIGKPLAVHLELPHEDARHFHGIVCRLEQLGWAGRRTLYRATLRPSLWLLSQKSGCRIFQRQSVPDIVRAVFNEHGLTIEDSLAGSYSPRDFVVQYRESDLAFVSRLMEQEGIYYFFRHEADKHTLVLADAAGAHQAAPGYDELPFFPPQEGARRDRDHVDTWKTHFQIEPSAFVLRDYDFKRPKANLEVKRSVEGGAAGLEVYDYPGGYVQSADGERLAATRLEELTSQQARIRGEGNARGLGVGNLFKLTGHPREDQNREYLVLTASYELTPPQQESGSGLSDAPVYRSRFSALESRTPFRPPCVTPKPRVRGIQTARVVGRSGEEIWTDEYGRVKVQFHWDREDKGDDASCWVRVSQAWAGARWGAIHIPRVGQEVVVDFLEGDPDCPLIVGQLYDADHMPPYALPANQTQSGFMSRSTKGGASDNANELRFEDKKGEEHVYLQAEKDHQTLVKNNETRTVGCNRTTSIGNDETVTVKANRTEEVGKDESVTITGNRTVTVGKDESVTIGGGRTEAVTKDDALAVTGDWSAEINGGATLSVGKDRTENIAKNDTLSIGGNQTVAVEKKLALSVKQDRTQSVEGKDSLQVGKALTIEAADQITLKCGDAQIVMKKDGTVTVKGKDLKLDGSGKINVKAGGDVIIKGSKVTQN